jgi:hypothetical protein
VQRAAAAAALGAVGVKAHVRHRDSFS